ncbi:hypothetical protein [Streptomyces lunaelactis]|uniref:hypothetical protein n=1 Tax=Streptomyces lunaelactis TaxID=1535768 RepID=UPI0015856E6C|nr:hypothetical protein [Streptomyces lunaelactis]NUK23700.1 hypothetical protein [Streptomyces lunaelactis]
MTLNPPTAHTLTRATIHRAGPVTVLVTVQGWYNEQLLAPVRTETLLEVTGRNREDLRRSSLWVMARLDATTYAGLALHGWSMNKPVPSPSYTAAAPPDSGADAWAGTLANTVPASRWAA